MKNILIISQKGGTGKTTIADNLAFALEAAGQPVAFYDTDPQGGALHDTAEPDGAAVAVIDTPGTLTDSTRDMIADAAVVIIPTRASALDMQPLARVRDMVAAEAPAVPVLIVINGWNRWGNARSYREWVEGGLRPTERVAVLSQSEAVPQAAGNGVSVAAWAPKSRPAKDLTAIAETVRGMLGGVK